jgi:phosphatidylserine decarboxylase
LWIKGRGFSIKTLLGDDFKDEAAAFEGGAVLITRLAPQVSLAHSRFSSRLDFVDARFSEQDYHRFHAPVDGFCGKQVKISGKYFTVNPIAIRSALDVFGENVRVVQPIYSDVFGQTFNIWVGAMMVGSIEMNVKEGDVVKKGQDVGYFKFGGSTIL